MRHIKIRYDFVAKRKVPKEGSAWNVGYDLEQKEEIPTNEKSRYIETAEHYENLIYCKNCKKANPEIDFYEIESGREYLSIFLMMDRYNDLCSVFRYVMENPGKYAKSFVNNYSYLTKKERDALLSIKVKREKSAKTRAGRPVLICPECGEKKSDFKFLTQSKDWKAENIFVHAYEIKEEQNKFILSVFCYLIFPSVNSGKLMYHDVNVRFVFNTETKNVYAFPPLYKDTMKPVYPEKNRILKITHMGNVENFMSDISKIVLHDKTIISYLAEYLCKKNGSKIMECLPKEYTIRDLLYYFRYPKLSIEARETVEDLYLENHFKNSSLQRRKRLMNAVYEMQDSPEKMMEEMRKKKIPNKKMIKKMAANNPFCIYIYRLLIKMGMKDYNVILDTINQIENTKCVMSFFVQIYAGLTPTMEMSKEIMLFLQDFIKQKGDIGTKNLVFAELTKEHYRVSDVSLLIDTVRLYTQIMEALDGEPSPVEFKNIAVMHDELSSVLRKLKNKNRKIPYLKDALKLNACIGDYSFALAPDTYSLIDCGEKLGICVGGYGNMAVNRSCIIVFLLKDKKYVGCIELSPNTKNLWQAKAKFNNILTGEAAYALKEWVKYNEIDSNCRDYTLMEEAFDSKSEYNYCITTKYQDVDSINKDIKINDDYLIMDEEKKSEETKKAV